MINPDHLFQRLQLRRQQGAVTALQLAGKSPAEIRNKYLPVFERQNDQRQAKKRQLYATLRS